ncbi:hypothetical protein COB55_03280 [Candidatus Wolfebacteria bacterium]|nr:MAG: hypothetical protein COB55_03280 [Candidatus Wolfebacteria bacterium]
MKETEEQKSFRLNCHKNIDVRQQIQEKAVDIGMINNKPGSDSGGYNNFDVKKGFSGLNRHARRKMQKIAKKSDTKVKMMAKTQQVDENID